MTARGIRRRNEDAFAFAVNEIGRVLAVVCDGVSSAPGSDTTSQVAADAAMAALVSAEAAPAAKALEGGYHAARAAVEQTGGPQGGNEGACTFLAAAVEEAQIELASLGDCRALWLPVNGQPVVLTEDDSWAAVQVQGGLMTTEEAYADPQCHDITRWIGADADGDWEPRRVSFVPPAPGRLVLCSDGLWQYAGDARELAIVAGGGKPLSVARRLAEWAIGQGGEDNVTVVVVDVGNGLAVGRPTQ